MLRASTKSTEWATQLGMDPLQRCERVWIGRRGSQWQSKQYTKIGWKIATNKPLLRRSSSCSDSSTAREWPRSKTFSLMTTASTLLRTALKWACYGIWICTTTNLLRAWYAMCSNKLCKRLFFAMSRVFCTVIWNRKTFSSTSTTTANWLRSSSYVTSACRAWLAKSTGAAPK